VGIGPNRLIANLASDLRKPDGLFVVRPEQLQGFLDPMPVSNLRGVGKQTEKSLKRLNIHTVAQLRSYTLEELQQALSSKGGQSLYNQARGIASDRVGQSAGRQSISKETTFNEDVTNQQRLRDQLRKLAGEVGYSARKKGLKGQVVTMKIRLEGFETHTRQRKLSQATNSDGAIFNTAWDLYRESGFEGRPVRLIGLGITEWGEGSQQADLFSESESSEREKRLYETLDSVVEKYGVGKIRRGIGK
jgi:DNA polymerase-4